LSVTGAKFARATTDVAADLLAIVEALPINGFSLKRGEVVGPRPYRSGRFIDDDKTVEAIGRGEFLNRSTLILIAGALIALELP
jgi:hypothetical protein